MTSVSRSHDLHVAFLARWLGFPNGMAESSRVRLLARALVESGVHVTVFSTGVSERPPIVENREPRGVYEGVAFEYTTGTTIRSDSFAERRFVAAKGLITAAARLRELKRSGRLDAVYLWWNALEWVPSRSLIPPALQRLGVPVVLELNERPWTLVGTKRSPQRLLSPLQGMQGVVAISRFLAGWASEEARSHSYSTKIIEIPILVDVGEQAVSKYPGGGDPVVLLASSPAYDQTLVFAFEAMKRVWSRFPAARLVITGANPAHPQSAWLLEEVHRGNLDGRVTLTGYVPRHELLELYAQAHALIIPLFADVRSEARFPTKIGEYLGSGRPVVTTAVGESARYLEDGVNAFVCSPGHAEEYGEKLCEVLSDTAVAERVGLEGRALAEHCFHYSRYGAELRPFFESVAHAPARS